MKSRIFVFLVLVFAFSVQVMAEENGFSGSFSVILNTVDDTIKYDDGSGNNMSMEFGVNINTMIFKNSNFGYYISFFGLYSRPIIPGNESLFFGLVPGIGYKKSVNDYLNIIIGVGPELKYTINDTEKMSDMYGSDNEFGFGIGGTIETRLQIYRKFSLAGGIRISSNFFERVHRKFIILPYIGFSLN